MTEEKVFERFAQQAVARVAVTQVGNNCRNCAHREGGFGRYEDGGLCLRAGYRIIFMRNHPNVGCDMNFSGWEPRKPWWRFW